jgi:glycosyltransferase involved in cell wall biosynthesis
MQAVNSNETNAKSAQAKRARAHVCMHVRGSARTDARVMREATALFEAGYVVSIVDVEQQSERPDVEYIAGVQIKHLYLIASFSSLRFKLSSFLKIIYSRLYSAYYLLRMPADVYHAHDVSALPACYLAARLRRKPLIFDSHELPLCNLVGTPWVRLYPLLAGLLKILVPSCSAVITVSPPIVERMRQLYRARKLVLVRNLHRYEIVQKSDHLQQYLRLGPQVRIALYQGNLQPSSGLDLLVRAAAFLDPKIVIVMMGKGVGTTPSELASLIEQEGVSDRVKIIPPISYEKLLEWTASADIGLTTLPPTYSDSIRMCLPNKLFEYLMAGLPVLSSELEAVVNVLRAYDVGRVVSSLTPADVGAAINAILADRVALARMSRNAGDAVLRELNWEKESQELIRLYDDILDMRNELQSDHQQM